MENIEISSLGPIEKASIQLGDLTLLVGSQASGKSIFLQLLKLIIDKKNIRKTIEQYNFVWGKDGNEVLNLFFGEGMQGIWKNNTKVVFDNKNFTKNDLSKKNGGEEEERLFYIPAQRVLSIADGRPRYFTEFDNSAPFVLRHFSETLRQLLNHTAKDNAIFPQSQRLKAPLRNSFNNSIFHDGKIIMDEQFGQKKLKMNIDGMSIPFMTWSAGQKEFMPLLLSFYWLCVSSKTSKRDSIQYVVIEEPEMGLHPQAINSVILQIIDLLNRGYKVIVSTHSPIILEFAWAFQYLKQAKAGKDALFELFDLKKGPDTSTLFKDVLANKTLKTYYFNRENQKVTVKDISSLDANNEDLAIAEWGGLSSFASKANDIIAHIIANEEA